MLLSQMGSDLYNPVPIWAPKRTKRYVSQYGDLEGKVTELIERFLDEKKPDVEEPKREADHVKDLLTSVDLPVPTETTVLHLMMMKSCNIFLLIKEAAYHMLYVTTRNEHGNVSKNLGLTLNDLHANIVEVDEEIMAYSSAAISLHDVSEAQQWLQALQRFVMQLQQLVFSINVETDSMDSKDQNDWRPRMRLMSACLHGVLMNLPTAAIDHNMYPQVDDFIAECHDVPWAKSKKKKEASSQSCMEAANGKAEEVPALKARAAKASAAGDASTQTQTPVFRPLIRRACMSYNGFWAKKPCV